MSCVCEALPAFTGSHLDLTLIGRERVASLCPSTSLLGSASVLPNTFLYNLFLGPTFKCPTFFPVFLFPSEEELGTPSQAVPRGNSYSATPFHPFYLGLRVCLVHHPALDPLEPCPHLNQLPSTFQLGGKGCVWLLNQDQSILGLVSPLGAYSWTVLLLQCQLMMSSVLPGPDVAVRGLGPSFFLLL